MLVKGASGNNLLAGHGLALTEFRDVICTHSDKLIKMIYTWVHMIIIPSGLHHARYKKILHAFYIHPVSDYRHTVRA